MSTIDVYKRQVDKSVEIHTFERLNGELLEEKKASPAGAKDVYKRQTVINVYYAANDQTYSVYYYLEGTETPVPGTTAKENVSAKFDETVTETAPAVTGYTVAGDSTMSITVGADNACLLYTSRCV